MRRKVSITFLKRSLRLRSALTFETKVSGKVIRWFVVRHKDAYYAYENLCKHVPVTLDCSDGQILSRDGKSIQCHMHGAVYEKVSGECVAGPCVGARLNRFDVVDNGDSLVVELPEGQKSS